MESYQGAQPPTPLRRSVRLAQQPTPKSGIRQEESGTAIRRGVHESGINGLVNARQSLMYELQSPTTLHLPAHLTHQSRQREPSKLGMSPVRSERTSATAQSAYATASPRSVKRTLLFDSMSSTNSQFSRRTHVDGSMFSFGEDAPIAIRKTPRHMRNLGISEDRDRDQAVHNSRDNSSITGINSMFTTAAFRNPLALQSGPLASATVAMPIQVQARSGIASERRRTDPGFMRMGRHMWGFFASIYAVLYTIMALVYRVSSNAHRSIWKKIPKKTVFHIALIFATIFALRIVLLFLFDYYTTWISMIEDSNSQPIFFDSIPDINQDPPKVPISIHTADIESTFSHDSKPAVDVLSQTNYIDDWRESIQAQVRKLEEEILELKSTLKNISNTQTSFSPFNNQSDLESWVQDSFQIALKRIALKPNLPPDHASLAAGTIPILDFTSPSLTRPNIDPISLFFGFGRLGQPPSIALSDDNGIGKCFSFAGNVGKLTIKLKHSITPMAVSIDHISASEVPDRSSAPRKCQVWALNSANSEQSAILLGSFEYQISDPRQNSDCQYFPLSYLNHTTSHPRSSANNLPKWDVLQLRVLSNWGRKDYTCIYRWRVHAQTIQEYNRS
jgi:hypothetical protein